MKRSDKIICKSRKSFLLHLASFVFLAAASSNSAVAGTDPCPSGGYMSNFGGLIAKDACYVGFAPVGAKTLIWQGWYAFLATDVPLPCRTFEHNKSAEHSYVLREGKCLVQRVPEGVDPFVAKQRFFYKAKP
jgi:hypothetical protein